MRDERIEAFISKDRTYEVRCPTCNKAYKYCIDDLPSTRHNPFTYECACGAVSSVHLVGFRAAHRKLSNLAASYSHPLKNGNLRILCTVLDISVKGMRFATEPVKNLSKGDVIKITLILDDARRSKLLLPTRIRRITRAKNGLHVSVEYVEPTNEQLDVLRTYVIS